MATFRRRAKHGVEAVVGGDDGEECSIHHTLQFPVKHGGSLLLDGMALRKGS